MSGNDGAGGEADIQSLLDFAPVDERAGFRLHVDSREGRNDRRFRYGETAA